MLAHQVRDAVSIRAAVRLVEHELRHLPVFAGRREVAIADRKLGQFRMANQPG